MKRAIFLSLLAVIGPCTAYQYFQDKIPNGDSVPHPCKANYLWQGVGHLARAGGGARNPFGVDFYTNGKVWDSCICNYDSDGDGLTNGEELGDPNCVWTEGEVPEQTSGLSHPGVCEPVDSATCIVRNKDLGDFCDSTSTVAPCIGTVQNETGMLSMQLSFPDTPVPANETTYMCQVFALPNDTDYHIVAAEPHIVNSNVMHHILLYGCQDTAVVTSSPADCGMAESDCNDLLHTWAVGSNGYCNNDNFGFRIGLTGYRKVLMQAHWNNPELRSDYTDSSGLVIYYTPNLRPYDGGMIMTGQRYLAIPRGKTDYMTWADCASSCTAELGQSIYITAGVIHMHYLGSSGYIEHRRNGSVVTDLVTQAEYSYDTPVLFSYDSPVEYQAGDTVRTICHFKTSTTAETTYYGEATNAEMCFGFLTYYPKIDLQQCVAYDSHQTCDNSTSEDSIVDGCDYDDFFNNYYTTIVTDLSQNCDITGSTCYSSCQSSLASWAASNPCMSGDALVYTKDYIRQYISDPDTYITIMESCDEPDTTDDDTSSGSSGGGLCYTDGNHGQPTSVPSAIPTLVGLGVALVGAARRG